MGRLFLFWFKHLHFESFHLSLVTYKLTFGYLVWKLGLNKYNKLEIQLSFLKNNNEIPLDLTFIVSRYHVQYCP
jgi:hypothetical protein